MIYPGHQFPGPGTAEGAVTLRNQLQPAAALVSIFVCHYRRHLITSSFYFREFKELVPNFSIRDAGEDQYRLPTSSTCVNLLKVRTLFPPATNQSGADSKIYVPFSAPAIYQRAHTPPEAATGDKFECRI